MIRVKSHLIKKSTYYNFFTKIPKLHLQFWFLSFQCGLRVLYPTFYDQLNKYLGFVISHHLF